MDVRVAVVLVLALACVQASSLYYGRCFGTVHSWERVDKGSSHHLEVYFNTVKDLDTGASYEAFAANVDIRSHSGSALLGVIFNGTQLVDAGIANKLKAAGGLKKLSAAEGVQYSSFLKASAFSSISEDSLVTLLESALQDAQEVYLFGQVYHDGGSNGQVGIHDIHRIVGSSYAGYGDGAFITRDSQGRFQGIFLHFVDQPVAQQD